MGKRLRGGEERWLGGRRAGPDKALHFFALVLREVLVMWSQDRIQITEESQTRMGYVTYLHVIV